VLSRYANEFAEQIERLNIISTDEDYELYFSMLCDLVAKEHKDILPELQFCQNSYGPTETQIININ